MIEVYPPFSDVEVVAVGSRVPATVLQIVIHPAGVSYEVGYWNAATWTNAYFNAALIESKANKIAIGFANAKSTT